MTVFENRLRTYQGWKLTFLTPYQMAEAGFYFIGTQDRVRCVYCTEEFDYWQRGVDPLAEHKRLSPECSFFVARARKYQIKLNKYFCNLI